MNKVTAIFPAIVLLLLVSCGGKKSEEPQSDPQSEAMLAGVWINEDDESVAFKVVKDTLYYPDADVMPAHFRIFGDTIYIDGATSMKYSIEKFTDHIFQFRNQNGESVKLIKTDDPDAEKEFMGNRNSFGKGDIIQRLVKRDTIVSAGDKHYHCYMQVNPTSYKVLKTDYNDEGVGVSKAYYDNIINVAVYDGARKLFSSDFHKKDFSKYVPQEVMEQGILSDVTFDHCDKSGIVFCASLRIPDSVSGYIIYIAISSNGKCRLSQPK